MKSMNPMKNRLGISAAVLALVLLMAGGTFALVHRVAHAATTRNVQVNCGGQVPPVCYTSISAAVAASNPGDVVLVHQGVFIETNTINITVPLTLQGMGAVQTSLLGTLDAEMINVTLSVPGTLTIKGMTIEGNGLSHAQCGTPFIQLYSALPTNAIEIADNKFSETSKSDPDHSTCFTEAYHNFNPTSASIRMLSNQFVGFSDVAEFFDDSGPLEVAGNDTEQLDGFGGGHVAFDEFTCCSALLIAPMHLFQQNTFGGYAGEAILVESNNANFHNLRIMNNTVKLVGANPQPAISVGGFETGGQVRLIARNNIFHISGNALAFQLNQAVTGTLQKNLLVGDGTAGSTGLNIVTGSLYPTSLSLLSNRITNFDFGLWVAPAMPPGGAATQMIAAQQNCIEGNIGYGAENTTAIQVQASNNWWGTASGPFEPISNPGGMGNSVFGPITFKPFLVAPAPTCP